jgi:hypothetical protein
VFVCLKNLHWTSGETWVTSSLLWKVNNFSYHIDIIWWQKVEKKREERERERERNERRKKRDFWWRMKSEQRCGRRRNNLCRHMRGTWTFILLIMSWCWCRYSFLYNDLVFVCGWWRISAVSLHQRQNRKGIIFFYF